MVRSQHIRDTATGLAAVMALLAIVVGVPAALVAFVGWPLPTAIPQIEAVGAALRHGQIAPSTLLKALAVVVWGTWGLMTAGIAVEFVALVRGTVARALPTVGGLQQVAGRLLTAAMLLSTLTARPAAAAVPAPAAMTADLDAVPPAAVEEEHAAPGADDGTYVVQRRDSLWTIAERTLGDGRRWREIRDLNAGRAQAGGGRLRADDVTIHPGWVLRLPAAADRRRPAERITVRRGDHLWGLAETYLGAGDRWRRIYDHNAGARQPDGDQLTQPDMIRPGWVLELPGERAAAHDRTGERAAVPQAHDHRRGDDTAHDGGPNSGDRTRPPVDRHGDRSSDPPPGAPVAPVPVMPSTLPDTATDVSARDGTTRRPAGAASPEHAPALASSSRQQPDRAPEAAPIGAIALLAAGLVGVLDRRRRRWLRHRRPGSALEPIDPEAAELERWLRAMADHDLSHRTDRVLRLLTELFAAHDLDPPVVALELGERVGLVLARALTAPPPGVTATADGRVWLLDPELEVAAPADDDQPPFIPALVTCGRRASGNIVALHLLHLGLVSVAGPADQVREVLTSWTTELATTGAADDVEIVVVGAHHDLVEQFARVTIAPDERAAVDTIERALGGGHLGGPAAAHVVVLSAASDDGVGRQMLRARVDGDPRVAAVLAGAVDADHRLRLDGDHVLLEPYGLDLVAGQWLSRQSWDRFDDLLRQPARQQPSDLVPSPLLTQPFDGRLAHLTPLDSDDDVPPARMVRVLGPLEVDGVLTPPTHVGDLLALLGVHRDGVRVETLAADLGLAAADVPAVVRSAHDALGDDDVEPTLLAVTDDGRLRLAGDMGCDVELFYRLVSRHGADTPVNQAGRLHDALALVRGVPFCDAGDWADAAGLSTTITALVSDVAHRLAALAMTFGDLDGAAWAVDQGLLANPGCELLFRDRMRIADARGDHAALDAVMHDLRTRAETDGGWVAAETVQLYERLRRSATIAAAPGAGDDRRHAS